MEAVSVRCLDGSTRFVRVDDLRTVGALRHRVAEQAGLPSASLLRLKSGCRDLCDSSSLDGVDASVHALLRLPGGTHNKYFFTGRMEAVRQKPNGGNVAQNFVHPSDTAGPHQSDVIPLINATDHHGRETYNMNPMILESIRLSDFFWDLSKTTTFAEVVDQIYYNVEYVTPYLPGTHKAMRATGMQSAVRGVSNAGTPSTAYTILLKLYIMRLTRTQVMAMVNHADSAFIKAMGFLYLRIGSLAADGFKDIWSWFEPHLDDKETLQIDGSSTTATTVGNFCRRLLTELDYFGDRLPRIPVLLQRQIDASLREKDRGGRERPRDERDERDERRDDDRDRRERDDRGGRERDDRGYDRGRDDDRGYGRGGDRYEDRGRDRYDDERGGGPSWRERERDGRDGERAERKRPAEHDERDPPKQARAGPSDPQAKREEIARLEARCRELRSLIAEKERLGER